jgi:large subunit ribosomal protein L18
MKKLQRRSRRKRGIRKKISGTKQKPRITVYRSNRHLYVQAIDDEAKNTLCSMSDTEAGVKSGCEGAFVIGQKLADKMKKVKVKEAVFDRNGYIYHGVVKSVADGVRKNGVKI